MSDGVELFARLARERARGFGSMALMCLTMFVMSSMFGSDKEMRAPCTLGSITYFDGLGCAVPFLPALVTVFGVAAVACLLVSRTVGAWAPRGAGAACRQLNGGFNALAGAVALLWAVVWVVHGGRGCVWSARGEDYDPFCAAGLYVMWAAAVAGSIVKTLADGWDDKC